MAAQRSDYLDARCSNCRSGNTQPISVAYEQSVRIGYSGRETVSKYAQSLAPPEPRDEKFLPSMIACAVALGTVLFGPEYINRYDVPFLQDISVFDWRSFVFGCILGWIVGLLIAAPAIRFNVWNLPDLLAEWESEWICKRCGHRWQQLAVPASDRTPVDDK